MGSGKGERVLRFLVRHLHEDAPTAAEVGARALGGRDGRVAAPVLRRLQEAGLVEAVGSGRWWRPTARGREVDATLDRIVVRRGGKFAGWYASGISIPESSALR